MKITMNYQTNEMDSLPNYQHLLMDIRKSFEEAIAHTDEVLFTTDAGDLYDIYLNHIPAQYRQEQNCHVCRRFVNTFGGLVRITPKGQIQSVLWNHAPENIQPAIQKMREQVEQSHVTGIFRYQGKMLGSPEAGGFHHMYVALPERLRFQSRLHTAESAMGKDLENFRMVQNATTRYTINTVRSAINILETSTLSGSEKFLAPAKWFLNILERCGSFTTEKQKNLLWQEIATSPEGFFHISSGMLGFLLDDIQAGYPLDTVRRRFNEKMDPLQYQRPQSAPTIGNVNRAEEIVEKLGIQNSLKRRFARVEELNTLWKPAAQHQKTNGIFADIQTKVTPTANNLGIVPQQTMTWEKFQRTILPKAQKIQFYVSSNRNHYSAIVTAEDETAPPILKWDFEDNRCPFNWYVYHGGSTPSRWNLTAGTYVDVTAVTLQPNLWVENQEHHGKAVFFILNDCVDSVVGGGSALFPEILKNELHEVRKTIEAYSNRHDLTGRNQASACGIRLQAGQNWSDAKFRVTTATGTVIYKLDRWD